MATPLPTSLNISNPSTAVGGNSSIAPISVTFPSLQRPGTDRTSVIIGAGVGILLIGFLVFAKRGK